MNKGRLIGGAICLAAGVLLAILTAVLEPDQMMFMIGDANVPIVPAVVLIIVGCWLLFTSKLSEEEKMAALEGDDVEIVLDEKKVALNKRLEGIAWGLFLIMLGGFSFVPKEIISRGVWSIGVGIIMLGLNAARYYYHIKMSGFTTFLGILSLFGGVAQLLRFEALEGALFFFILGAYLILKPWFEKKQLFGKAA